MGLQNKSLLLSTIIVEEEDIEVTSVFKDLTGRETRSKLRAFAGRNGNREEKFGVML
jgi:hypothetical protein